MQHLTIDLAERHTGMVRADEAGGVLWEGVVDVGERNKVQPHVHINALSTYWINYLMLECDEVARVGGKVWIEDCPPHAINPKPIFRLQGALIDRLGFLKYEYELVLATRWQRELGYKKVAGRTSKGWAKEMCDQLGYEPSRKRGKAAEDLRDAYLFNRWAHGWRP
jgi:hypothetical protein